MSGHGTNPIFFNKKKKLDVQNTCYHPPPYIEKHLIFALATPPYPLQLNVICVSPLALGHNNQTKK